MTKTLKNKFDLDIFVEVRNGNPNGDPDADGRPRQCSLTYNGLMTDVSIKRKIRNYLQEVFGDEQGMEIFFQEGVVLNDLISAPYDTENAVKKANGPRQKELLAQAALTKRYYDIRAFGAVLSTGDKGKTAGRVTGPIQVTMAESLDPIIIENIAITRCCATNKKDEEKERTMGTKYRIPYALYRFHIYISSRLAAKAGFNESDLAKLKGALVRMWDSDHSSSRGEMSLRKAFCFKHDSDLGNAPARVLFDCVKVERKADVPSKSDDYEIALDKGSLPKGISVEELKW